MSAAALRRKLHAWELLHLREVLAEQQALIEQLQAEAADLQRRLSWAEDCADSWRDDALRAIEGSGCTPGLTLAGQVVAIHPGAMQ